MPLYSGLDEYTGHELTREEYEMREEQEAEQAAKEGHITGVNPYGYEEEKRAVVRQSDAMEMFSGMPSAGLQRATMIADALSGIIKSRGLSVRIQNSEHLKIEAWLTLAAMSGLAPITEWVKKDEEGYHARVRVVRIATGAEVGAAESRCDYSETLKRRDGSTYDRWNRDEPHSCMSMAQTRATSKAIAQVCRWIPVLAGYSGTPLEEMPYTVDVNDTGRAGAVKEHGAPRPKVSLGAGTPPARPVTIPNASEHGLPLTPDMLSLPFLDEKLNFGKHKDKTWRDFCEGGAGSGRVQYLGWLMNQEAKSATQIMNQKRAETVWALVGLREAEQSEAAGSQVPDPKWDK